MKNKFFKIFYLQKQLDSNIHKTHNLSYETVKEKLKLALLVELAELANEIRCFKFWSLKQPSPKNIVLEEYVDGIHFITSLSIFYGVDPEFLVKRQEKIDDRDILTEKLISLFKDATNLKNKKTVKKWYQDYLSFGCNLGFSDDDIIEAYKHKNDINHDRQKNKY